MKVFAISDLHLSTSVDKPMGVFGGGWENHFSFIAEDWKQKVSDGDLVLLGGDMSWGMTIEEAKSDYALVGELPGIKIVCKGNHDYYWNSLSKMRSTFKGFHFLQNNCFCVSEDGDVTERFCANDRRAKKQSDPAQCKKKLLVAGSRGWNIPTESSEDADKKIYTNELARLETSLKAASELKEDGDILIALLHYPPFEADYADTAVTALLEKYGVQYALYGHLHGKRVRITPALNKRGVTYLLTSCDIVQNKLVFVTELGESNEA